jgi:hypothetical protein
MHNELNFISKCLPALQAHVLLLFHFALAVAVYVVVRQCLRRKWVEHFTARITLVAGGILLVFAMLEVLGADLRRAWHFIAPLWS